MVYTVEELKRIIAPIARKYEIPAVYLFGSYARGEATDTSDVDILLKREGSKISGLAMGALYNELSENLGKGLDLITEEALEQHDSKRRTPWFYDSVHREKVIIYGES